MSPEIKCKHVWILQLPSNRWGICKNCGERKLMIENIENEIDRATRLSERQYEEEANNRTTRKDFK